MDKKANRTNRTNTFAIHLNTIVTVLIALALIVSGAIAARAVLMAPVAAPQETAETGTGVQGGAFEVTSYDLNAVVNSDHSYNVEEKISVSIPDQIQSIEFAIPSGNFRMSDLVVEDALYQAKTASEASTVVISDQDKLTKGDHVYTIKYTIYEYRDFDDSKDMFYFDVLLPEWKQPVSKVNINVSFPDDFPWDDMQCYAGQFGVQDSDNKISFDADEKAHTVTVTGSLIPENYGITLKAQLPDGYWKKPLDGSWSITAITLIMAITSLALLVLWLIGGRDPKIKRKAVTKPIEGLEPVEIGYAFNSEVRRSDVLHMIIRFAQKGYLRISEYEPKRYRLYKGNDPAGEEKMFRNAYNILFEDVYKNRALEMEDMPERLERIRSAITDDVAAGFAASESSPFTPISRAFRLAGAAILGIALAVSDAISYYYAYQSPNYIEAAIAGIAAAAAVLFLCRAIDDRDSSTVTAGRSSELIAMVLTAIPVFYTAYRVSVNTGKPYAAIAMLAASAASIFLIIIMRARGRENAKLVTQVRRLRNFIYHPTAKELLENHLADSNYYYDMMIYALAFGAEESWAISFLTLDVPEPDWYSDDIEGHAFSNLREGMSTIDYARDIRSFIRTILNGWQK